MPATRQFHLRAFLRSTFATTLIAATFLWVSVPRGFAQEQDVLRATLPNGLRVIVVHNGLAPVVATSVNYLVGSDEAPDGFPGMAHAQEHMMFRGSPGLSADQLANIGSIIGGNFNANTREGLTQYHYTVPSEDLDVALRIEAARMRDVLDNPADWDQERGAIEQEVARDLSNPGYVLFSRLRATLFAGTPYEHDALGTKSSFDKTSAEMLKRFHDAWYAPNNAVLIVVGNLDPDATLSKIKQLFGTIRPKHLPPRPSVTLRPLKSTSFTIDTDQPNGSLMLAIRVPGLASSDFPAMELLSDVLSSMRFDLYGLVPQGKALSAGFGVDPLQKAGMAYATASFPAGDNPKAIENDIRAILTKVKTSGVSAELVEAAKLQERREAEFEKNSIAGLASEWAEAIAVYGLNAPADDLARIEKVTVADVNRVARKYLDLDNAVVAVMIPQGSGKPVPTSSGFGGQEEIALGEAKPTPLPEWAQAALDRLSVPPSITQPTVSTLPNGLTLMVLPEDVSDTVSVYGHVKNRPETETAPGKDGVAQILNQLLSYGSETLDRVAFQQALDDIGASARAGTDFSVQILAKDFDRGTELLADNVLHPALPDRAMTVIRNQQVQVVGARNRSPGFLVQKSLREGLYPAGDPSLRDPTPETVQALTLDDVRTYYHTVFRPDLTTIVIVGKTTPQAARATVDRYFGTWTATGRKPETELPAAPNNKPSAASVPDASRVQDGVLMAQTLGLTRADPDYYALQLGNSVLGGGLYSTRLSNDLRKNTGLVYTVGAGLQAGKTRGVYVVQYACDPANVAKAADIVARDIRQMQAEPATAEELTRTKAMLLRQIPLRESSVAAIARGFIDRRDEDLPLDEPTVAARRYLALSASDVQAAFKKWLRPDDLVRISEGPTP